MKNRKWKIKVSISGNGKLFACWLWWGKSNNLNF